MEFYDIGKGDQICIGGGIYISIAEIRFEHNNLPDRVRLGVTAPREVPVHRQEVYEAIHGKPADTEPSASAVAKPVE